MLPLIILLLLLALFLGVWIPLRKKQREKKHQERLETITRLTPDIEAALAEICTFYSYSHYITESERIALDDKYADLNHAISAIINSKELEECSRKESFKRFHRAMSDTKGHKTATMSISSRIS